MVVSRPDLSKDDDGLSDEVCSDEDDFSDILNVDFSTMYQLSKLILRVRGEADENYDFLEHSELSEICEALEECQEPVLIRKVVAVNDLKNDWGEHQPLVDELRAAIYRDYDTTVLSGHVDWSEHDTPICGDNCRAVINLKLGAQGKAQQQIW